jgi:hypothetical protein
LHSATLALSFSVLLTACERLPWFVSAACARMVLYDYTGHDS